MSNIVVTGASRGIGLAIAERFLENGDVVLANYNNTPVCSDGRGKLRPFKADISSREGREALFAYAGELFGAGGADVLVNNAGIDLFGVFQSLGEKEVSSLYATDLSGVIETTRLFLPQMINKKSGCIISVTSMFGRYGGACEVDYSAAKAAVAGFTRALAKEVGPSGVRVNCVAPGVIDTDMNSRLGFSEVQNLIDTIPLERLGKPSDVAEAVFFLASAAAGYITGAEIPVDGGI